MATIKFSSVGGEAVTLAGSPPELADPYKLHGFGFVDNDDWYDVSDSKSPVDERPASTGGFGVARDWRSALPITVNGWYLGPDRAAVRAARRRLKSVIAQGTPVRMRWTDEDEATERVISVRSVSIDNLSELVVRFEIIALAPDPLAYGDVREYSVGVAAGGGGLVWPLGSGSSDEGSGPSTSFPGTGTFPGFYPGQF